MAAVETRAQSGRLATTSGCPRVARLLAPSVLRRQTAQHLLPCGGVTGHGVTRRLVLAAARRGGRPDPLEDRRSEGFQFSKQKGAYWVSFGRNYEFKIREEEAWKLAVPMLGGLILATSLIGPLLVGIAFTTVAIGAALSAGALFTSLFLPFFVMAGMGALFFGITTFSAFATLGTALLLPNLISLAVAGAGLGLGAMAVGLVLRPAAERAKDRYNEEGNGQADSGRRGKVTSGEPEVTVEVDPETDRQLKEFDELLKDREAARRRAERFRQGR